MFTMNDTIALIDSTGSSRDNNNDNGADNNHRIDDHHAHDNTCNEGTSSS
jgi:hypothetical protein